MATTTSSRRLSLPTFFIITTIMLWMATTFALALPGSGMSSLQKRTDPYFPDTPASCPICAKDYDSIRSCAEAAPVFENFTNVIFNPGAFVDTIQCACADTFRAVFPQCVDCFIQTGQEAVIMGHDLPAVVEGVRRVCTSLSSLLGNVTATNNATANAPSDSSALSIIRNPTRQLWWSVYLAVGLSIVSAVLSQ